MIVMIDNYDSFVYNLVRYFEELGETICVYRNDAIDVETIKQLKPKGIVISPGPKDPTQTGICETIIKTFSDQIPILGVCLGHQAIAYVHGAKIIKGHVPVHGKLSDVSHTGIGVFKNLPEKIRVTRYHSLVVDETTLSPDFHITARSHDHYIMGIKHKTLMIEGVQFHPEAVLTEYGHEMLQNFVDWCEEVKGDNAQ